MGGGDVPVGGAVEDLVDGLGVVDDRGEEGGDVLDVREGGELRGVGGWVGGWVFEKVEENEAVRMSDCELGCGWVGGWVGGWFTLPVRRAREEEEDGCG